MGLGISDADRQKFEQAVSEAFDKKIQKGKKFKIVDELGPDTVGPSEIYLSSIGEATLVLELLDAEAGERRN